MIKTRYTATARALHWLIALLLVAQIGLGLASDWGGRNTEALLLPHHVRFGILIFGLMLLRLLWRISHRPPRFPSTTSEWQATGARFVHASIYLVLFTLPISGYILWVWIGRSVDWGGVGRVPRLFEPPAEDETWRSIAGYIHEYAGYALYGLVAIHIAAALWHQFFRRDGLIRERML